MTETPCTNYLAGYPPHLVAQVRQLIAESKLGDLFLKRYPLAHEIRTDRALYDFVEEVRGEHMRNTAPLSKVLFDNKLHVIRQALGTHTAISRVQGSKLKAKREIRVAGVFREVPLAFLRMIVVHELAHTKERGHDKAFYKLCCYMEPEYHQLEFDLRAYLMYREATGNPLWTPVSTGRTL